MPDFSSNLPVRGTIDAFLVSGNSWAGVGSVFNAAGSVNATILGSVAVTSQVAWTGVGSVFAATGSVNATILGSVAITTSPVPVSGNAVGVYGQSGGTYYGLLTDTAGRLVTETTVTQETSFVASGNIFIVSGNAWAGVGSVFNAAGSVNATVLGSVAVTSGQINVVGGSVIITNTPSANMFVVSGNNWAGVGSVFNAAGSVNATVLGSVAVTNTITNNAFIVSGNNWVGVGSVFVAAGSIVVTNALGSVAVTNTVTTTEGAIAGTHDYNTSASLAAGGSNIHYYTSTGSFYIKAVKASASGMLKASVGTGSPAVTAVATGFNSTAKPDIDFSFPGNYLINSGTYVAVIRWNREATSAQDVYSHINGLTT